MAKNALEKAIEKQMKQTKQLDAKRKREEDKRAREEAAEARKTAIREKSYDYWTISPSRTKTHSLNYYTSELPNSTKSGTAAGFKIGQWSEINSQPTTKLKPVLRNTST